MPSSPLTADATQPTAHAEAGPAPVSSPEPIRHSTAELLVCLPALAPDALPSAFEAIASAFPTEPILVACAAPPPDTSAFPTLELIPYTSARSDVGWFLAAGDYSAAAQLALQHNARAVILLGGDTGAASTPNTLDPTLLRSFVDCMRGKNIDLVLPRFALGPNDALVNSALLYPLSRALFGADIRFPLPIDAAISGRLAQRLVSSTQRLMALNQGSSLLWPVAEAAAAGFTIAEVPAGPRALPPPDATDLNTLLAQVAGSLFADIDAKASFWQRARLAYTPRSSASSSAQNHTGAGPGQTPPEAPDIQPMLDSFRLAYTNLHEIWSLVLPPNSLLGLKKLSLMPPAAFRMPDALWARIVYDFILAYRLRTINRGHLLGALTPLYLAWVASHLLLTSGVGAETMAPEKHIETLAAAFEADKPYLVSRWRWPDRFNP